MKFTPNVNVNFNVNFDVIQLGVLNMVNDNYQISSMTQNYIK